MNEDILNNQESETVNDKAVVSEKKTFSFNKEVFEWFDAVAFAVVFVVLLFTFIFKVATVDGESMVPTFDNGDRIIISGLFYTPKQGDIVVLSANDTTVARYKEKPLIKRIIALGGQTIELRKEGAFYVVYVDGEKIQEDYIRADMKYAGDCGDKVIEVPKGYVFVMGDNRNESADSRLDEIGFINENYILGKAVFQIYPFDKIGAKFND